MAVLESLFVRLGYEVDQEKIDDFNEGVERTARGMKRIVLSAIAAATAIALFTKKMTDIQNVQTQLAKNLNIPVNLAQAWQDAANDMGIDTAKAVSSLTKINSVLENLTVGIQPSGSFLRGLADLNLELSDIENLRADQALLKISKGLSSLEPKVRGGVASLLGLRDELNFLSNPQLGSLISENISGIDTQNLTELTKLWSDFSQAARKSSLIFANEVAPAIGEGLKHITNLFQKLNDVIKDPQKALLDLSNKVIKTRDDFLQNDRASIGKLLESDIGQNAIKFVNDSFGTKIPTLPPELTPATGTANTTSNTINNDIKIDIVTDNPLVAGSEVEKAIENSNRKALSNLESLQVN